MAQPKRIGIDCRLSGLKHAGIGRYIQHLVREIIPNHLDVTWVLFFFDQDQAEAVLETIIIAENIEIRITPVSHYSVLEQLLMPWHFYQAQLDLLHVPHFNSPVLYFKKQLITIHDLLWHTYKGTHVTTLSPVLYYIKYWLYRLVTRISIAKAAHILVPTNTVATVVTTHYPAAAEKITTTYEGVRLPETTSGKHTRPTKELLYVGSLYPHKNITLVLQALQQLPDWKLNIVSARSVFHETIEKEIEQRNLNRQITFLGRVSDQELVTQYLSCTALIQPSLSEGFGLTGIEALSLGTPVIASDIPTFREVYEDLAEYVDPHSVDSLVDTLNSFSPPKNLGSSRKHFQEKYNWQSMAEQTWNQYQQCL